MIQFKAIGIGRICASLIFWFMPLPESLGQKLADVKKEKKARHLGTFTIGKETTYLDGPLDSEGYIDYQTALNRRMSQGVTPENNANVLIWQALGPHPDGTTMPKEYFNWLGIPIPPEKGQYFIPLEQHFKELLKFEPEARSKKISERLARFSYRAWEDKEDVPFANWLKANEKCFALFIEASKRSDYFDPCMVPKEDPNESLFHAKLPSVSAFREMGKALTIRAMLRMKDQPEAAWQDLLACYRLSRLVGRGTSLIAALAALSTERAAYRSSLAYLHFVAPDADRIRTLMHDLEQLPQPAEIADKYGLTERYMLLQLVLLIDRDGMSILDDSKPLRNRAAEYMVLENTDWDPALKKMNQFCDRVVTALQEKNRAIREQKVELLISEIRALVKKSEERQNGADLIDPITGPAARGEAMGNILLRYFPGNDQILGAIDRSHQQMTNLHLAFALALYQRENGTYPNELQALVPKYLPAIPDDLYTGQPLKYCTTQTGYLLSSVGPKLTNNAPQDYADRSTHVGLGAYLGLGASIIALLSCPLLFLSSRKPAGAAAISPAASGS